MALNSGKSVISNEGKRFDNRHPMHVRPTCRSLRRFSERYAAPEVIVRFCSDVENTRGPVAVLRTGAVSVAAGSAYAEFGSTKVIVSVYGPRESKKAQAFSDTGRLNCDVKFTCFSTNVRSTGGQDIQGREYSSLLHKALEGVVDLQSFPKTTVDVFGLILQSSGGDLAAVITCASLALADAGIVMFDLIAAISVSMVGRDLLLDPTSEEESCEDGNVLVAAMTSRKEITQVTFTGEWSSSRASQALDLCLDACAKLGAVMRTYLKEDAAEGS